MNNKTITGNGISQASLVNYVSRVLNLGLDVHYRQVTVAMQEDGGRIKAGGKMGHADFLNWVRKKLEEGWKIYSCYEAGASGYWLHRELVKLGVKNLVVVPKAMGRGGQKQKTDKRDSLHSCPWRNRVRSSCSCNRDRWRRLPDCFFRGCVFALCFSFGESFSVF